MTPEKLAQIRARQMPDSEKRRRADIVIPTGLSKGLTWRCVGSVIRDLSTCRGSIWPPR
jgi:dephospho-CoA kinase